MSTQTLAGYVEASSAATPDAVAVVDPSGRETTYAALDDRAARVAAHLLARGVQPGDRVGLLLPKGADAVAIMLGALKVRAAYVPVDYTGPLDRARTILGDCAVSAVFLHPRCAAVVRPDGAWQPAQIVVGDEAQAGPGQALFSAIVEGAPAAAAAGRRADDLAYILYTSGSTGIPKGVMLTQENATSFVEWASAAFTPGPADRFSSHAPFHFDLSVLDLYLCFKHGAALHVVSEDLGKNPKELARFVAERRLTIWYSTPSTLALLAQFGGLEALDCDSLRVVLFAGEVFPVKHLREIVAAWPHARFYNLYGPTETNVCTFARIPERIPEDRTAPYPIGHLCAHCDGLVLDEDGAAVPPGSEGLLHIAGPSLFPGYWNRPADNARVFHEREGRRWYNTGDVVRDEPAEGYIYLGRRDRMVKRRGYRIELGEIERGLYQHGQVREAAVIAVPDASSGVRIAAFVTARQGERPTIIDMKAFCARQLLSYMSPDVFVFVDALPMTSTGKVDYQALARTMQGAGV